MDECTHVILENSSPTGSGDEDTAPLGNFIITQEKSRKSLFFYFFFLASIHLFINIFFFQEFIVNEGKTKLKKKKRNSLLS